MQILILHTAQQVEALAARMIADRLKAKPNLVLGCATGRTMEGVYDRLVELASREKLDFGRVTTFNLDEYVGLTADDPQSYHYYMAEKLFSRVNLRPGRTHVPNGMARDLAAEAVSYEERIKAAGGIDLQLLDLALTPMTQEQNAGMFGDDPSKVPTRALTMGVGTILEAREALLIVTGAHKAQILATAVEGPVTSMVSATALQFHANCCILVDEAAAEKLVGREEYRRTFVHEPTWAPYRDFILSSERNA